MKIDPGKILVYSACIIVGLAFAWWIDCERLDNAEAMAEWSPDKELIYEQEEELCEAVAQGEDEWNEILERGYYDTKKYGRVYIDKQEVIEEHK